MRVAEASARRVPHQLFRDPAGRVRVLAAREQANLARLAVAARDADRHADAIAGLQILAALADLDDLAHQLVAEDGARLLAGHEPVVEVEVRAADRGRGDLHDRVARVEDLRIRYVLARDVLLAFEHVRAHQATPLPPIAVLSGCPRPFSAVGGMGTNPGGA